MLSSESKIKTWLLVLLAALVTFPARIPGLPQGLRTSEIVSFAATLGLIACMVLGKRLRAGTTPLLVAAGLTVCWFTVEVINYEWGVGEKHSQMMIIRWIASFPVAYWLATLMSDSRYRTKIIIGLVLGSLLSLGSVVYDELTFRPNEVAVSDDDAPPVWVYGEYRPHGVFSHPNAAAAAILFAIPLIIGAIEERRLHRGAVIIAITILGATYSLTLSRGPAVIAVAIIGWHLAAKTSRRIAVGVVLLTVFLVLRTITHFDIDHSLLVLERLADTSNIQSGASDRLLTTMTSLNLALTNPFGVGSRYEDLLGAATGYTATHNGYLQLALLGGIPIALYITAMLVLQLKSFALGDRRAEAWTALYLLGSLMFENHFFVPTFQVIALWLLSRPPFRLEYQWMAVEEENPDEQQALDVAV
jgi:hypothetical protein